MTEVLNVTKLFGGVKPLDAVTLSVGDGSIYGLVGSNGSGKSTLLRVICGIYMQNSGEVLFGGVPVFDNEQVKRRIFYLSDDQYFLPHSTIRENALYLSSVYPGYDVRRAEELAAGFGLPAERKINTFSKGMKRQTSVLLALAARPELLCCDETFDGLDPVIRESVRRLLAQECAERRMSAVIASHSLRELEDICDHIGLLHRGRLLFDCDIDLLRDKVRTVQAAFSQLPEQLSAEGLEFIRIQTRGNMITAVVRGDENVVRGYFDSLMPLYCELIPLTLEEIFITEMEERGYDSGKLTD